MKKNINILKSISIASFALSIICIFLQFYSSFFSSFISPFIILSLVLSINISKITKSDFKTLFILVILLTLNVFISIVIFQNEVTVAIRFYLILIALLISIFVRQTEDLIKVFVFIVMIFIFFLIYKEIYYILHPGVWINDRLIWKENGIGDVYTFNNFWYKIQIKGTPLIPIAFFLVNLSDQFKFRKTLSVIIIIGILVAGNLMYLVATIMFIAVQHIIRLKENNGRINIWIICVYIIMIVSIPLIVNKFMGTLTLKDEYSWPVRLDQLNVLFSAMSDSIFKILFGAGIGFRFKNLITQYRDYSNTTYFELQIVYVFAQLGIFGFIAYILSMINLIKKHWNNIYLYLILFCYYIYGISNPYIFDSTNLIVFMLINSLKTSIECERKEKLWILE